MPEWPHCWHPDTAPGSWACCACTAKASGFPGDCRGDHAEPCVSKPGRLRRHYRDPIKW